VAVFLDGYSDVCIGQFRMGPKKDAKKKGGGKGDGGPITVDPVDFIREVRLSTLSQLNFVGNGFTSSRRSIDTGYNSLRRDIQCRGAVS
jgi:hypothetical protein